MPASITHTAGDVLLLVEDRVHFSGAVAMAEQFRPFQRVHAGRYVDFENRQRNINQEGI